MGRLIRPKTWDGNCRNFGDFWDSRECPETVVAYCVRICVINSILVIRRSEMEMKSVPPRGTGVGSVGCPWTAHLLCFGTVKTVPGSCAMDKNCPCVVCSKLYEMNGLRCVELVRLIH